MDLEYEFARIDESQYQHFATLVRASFGTSPSIAEVRQLFHTGALGAQHIAFMAYRGGEPAAFYGVFPCRVEFDGAVYVAAQSGSTMTHPDHRKKGLFVEAARRTFDLAQEEGIRFIFGFPNEASFPGFMKLGWAMNGFFNSYQIFVPTAPVGIAAARAGAVSGLYSSMFRRAFEDVAGDYRPPVNSVIEEGVGGIQRDENLVRYRAASDTRFVVQIEGARVWLSEHDGSLGVGDIGPFEGANHLKAILTRLKGLCIRAGISRIVTYLSPDCKLDRCFRDAGYKAKRGLPICYFDLDSKLPLDNFKFVYGDFDTF